MAHLFTIGAFSLLSLMLSLPCFAAKKTVTDGPLPTAISEAKKVFLMNSSSLMAMSEFSAELKKWHRFQFVRSVAEADLVMELRFAPLHEAVEEYRTYDIYTKQISVHNAMCFGPNLALIIYGSDSILLTDIDKQRPSGRNKGDHTPITESADRLAERLRTRLASSR